MWSTDGNASSCHTRTDMAGSPHLSEDKVIVMLSMLKMRETINGSVCAGREKWPLNVIFALKEEPPFDQTWWDSHIVSIVSCLSYVLHVKNTLVGPVGPFSSTLILTVSTPNRLFLALRTYDKQLAIEKRGYLIRFCQTEALLLKRTLNSHFSCPDPYIVSLIFIIDSTITF